MFRKHTGFVALLCAVLTCGCGGLFGARGASPSASNNVVVNFDWTGLLARSAPTSTIRADMYSAAGVLLSSRKANMPTTGTTTQLILPGATGSEVQIVLSEFGSVDASGQPNAVARCTKTVSSVEPVQIASHATAVTRIAVDQTAMTLTSGGSRTLVVTGYSSTGAVVALSPYGLTWTSSNPDKASVKAKLTDASAVIQGIAEGTSTIAVHDTLGNYAAPVTATVSPLLGASPIDHLSLGAPTITMGVGEQIQLSAHAFDASGKEVSMPWISWTSSTGNVTVDNPEYCVYARLIGNSEGTSTVTITDPASGKTASVAVTVSGTPVYTMHTTQSSYTFTSDIVAGDYDFGFTDQHGNKVSLIGRNISVTSSNENIVEGSIFEMYPLRQLVITPLGFVGDGQLTITDHGSGVSTVVSVHVVKR